MSRDTCIELSSSSSRESLAEEPENPRQEEEEEEEENESAAAAAVPSAREIDWKKQQQQTRSEEEKEEEEEDDEDEIEICGSKLQQQQQGDAAVESPLARDVRRLKSATLDRMGKMLKIHSKSSGEKPDGLAAGAAYCGGEEPTRKQKFNSLTRMLRFADKEDKSKSLGQYRGRSLTRILRRKVPIEGDSPADKPNEHVRGIFSRILNQIRGRASKADSTTANSSQKSKEKSMMSPKSPSSSAMSELNLENSCPMNARHQA